MAAENRTTKMHMTTAFLWLFCVIGVLTGNEFVLAQGKVSGVTVTTNVASVTVPVGTAAAFAASSTEGTPQPDDEWNVIGGATYSWSVTAPATVKPVDAAETTVNVTYSSPGIYPITVTCTVSYAAVKDDGTKGTISGEGSADVNIYVIGGPITGGNDESYFCTPNDVGAYQYLQAASGQPTGTTYTWSMSGNATYCDTSKEGQPTNPTTASVVYRGVHPGSKAVGDVTATVTYSLNGVSAKSPNFPITVHTPVSFTILSRSNPNKLLPPAPEAYGFNGQHIIFQVLDGLGKALQNAYWDESWDDPQGGGTPTGQGGGPLSDSGQSQDNFYEYGLNEPQNPNGDKLQGPLTHIYCVTDTGETGGLIGCQVQEYTNVYYYTYGLTGNGF